MEPLLKGPAGLEYLEKAFVKHHGPPSDASTSLPLTTQWLLSVWDNRDQEWGDHTAALSDLRNRNGASGQILVPSTTLRTGGNLPARATGSQVASFSLDAQGKSSKFVPWVSLYPTQINYPNVGIILFYCT